MALNAKACNLAAVPFLATGALLANVATHLKPFWTFSFLLGSIAMLMAGVLYKDKGLVGTQIIFILLNVYGFVSSIM